MITHAIGPTVITICESTAKCTVSNPTDTLFNATLDYINQNNYICVAASGKLAEKFVYYAGGTAVASEDDLEHVEREFE